MKLGIQDQINLLIKVDQEKVGSTLDQNGFQKITYLTLP